MDPNANITLTPQEAQFALWDMEDANRECEHLTPNDARRVYADKLRKFLSSKEER